MKKCNGCGKNHSLDNFHNKKSSSDGHSSKCKLCMKEYQVKHYSLNKEVCFKRNKERRKFLSQKIDELKKNPCKDCGKQYEPFCMDFDHLRDKIMPISKMIHESFSIEKIKKEIEKCELVCVLCHKDRTHKRLQVKGRKKQFECYNRNRQIVILAKNNPCNICNVKYNYWQMEFDHLLDKTIDVAHLINGCAEERIHNEIKKCQLLCAMCHRIKTKLTLWNNSD